MTTRDDVPDRGPVPGSMKVTIYDINEQPRSPRDVELKVTDTEDKPLTIILWQKHDISGEWEIDATYELSGGRGRRYNNTAGNDVIIHSNDSFTIERVGEGLDTTQLLVIGDTHLGYRHRSPADKSTWGRTVDNRETMEEAFERARALDVDAVLHAGDIFDHEETEMDRQYLRQAISRLTAASIPIYYILGNHDTDRGRRTLEETSAVHLGGNCVDFGAQSIVVHGRDYSGGALSESLPSMTRKDLTASSILMLHDTPYPAIDKEGSTLYRNDTNRVDLSPLFESAIDWVDLIIVGHMHVGQIGSIEGLDVPLLVTGPTGTISKYEQESRPSTWLLTVTDDGIEITRQPL